MTDQQYGCLARAFVLANRAFGWITVAAGVSLAGEVVVGLFRGRSLDDIWLAGVSAAVLVLIGVVYVRAPLFRSDA